ncbi:MAG: hypothetical protein JXC32_17415 [Anaerolineae bacterium]|nr:hypothetical protein [Anaerolineae bacterium]
MPNEIHLDSLITAYDAFQAFEERCYTLLHAMVDLPQPQSDVQRRLMHTALARLATGHDMDEAVTDIGWVNEQPEEGNMFVWHVNADAYLRFGHLYPPELEDLVQTQLTSHAYVIHDGQTENHKLMIAVAGYLVAQTWPEWAEAEDTANRMAAYLQAFFDRVVRYGQGEFDSPTYGVLYLNTLATLYDFALDPRMRHEASMMLDWFLVNIAGEWLDGLFAGAHARDYFPAAGIADATGGRAVGWLYFGGQMPAFEQGEPHYAVINALSGYRVPEVIAHMAQDRDRPYTHLETHDLTALALPTHDDNATHRVPISSSLAASLRRANRCGRPSVAPGTPGAAGIDAETALPTAAQGFGYITKAGVYKTTYMTPDFALGSIADGKQGDIIWSGQLRRWSLVWQSDVPASVIFFTHPFPDGPHDQAYRQLWRGSSPYEQVLQHETALIAVYSIPEGGTYTYAPREPVPSDADPYIEGFFPEDALLLVQEDPSGWIFAHGGTVLIAVHPLRPYVWLEDEPVETPLSRLVGRHRRLHSPGLKNGVVVQLAKPESYDDDDVPDPVDTLNRFRAAVLARTSVEATLDLARPSVHYTSLAGDTLRITYDGDRIINGGVVDFSTWPLIENPFAWSAVGSGVLELRYGERMRILDYTTWSVRDSLA